LMEERALGRLWPVSAFALGGGGVGQVWGPTSREEAVATVREAAEAGITLLDMAPVYGDGEAERVVGEAFAGRLPDGMRLTTKCRVGSPSPSEVLSRLERSLDDSLERMRVDFIDVFFVHGHLVATADEGDELRTPLVLLDEAVRPALERLVSLGRIGAWGITGIGVPSVVLDVIGQHRAPSAVQAITNVFDSEGVARWFDEPARPRDIIAAAQRRGIGTMGIRAAHAGALTDTIDRDLPADSPLATDFRRAEPLRRLARDLGCSTASLAHRYALSIPGVDTVVLGVKNRTELRDCLAAEASGPLPPELVDEIHSRLAA
jgi:aryl-alcohol dehydrogenase-like predicted oxidoreductase